MEAALPWKQCGWVGVCCWVINEDFTSMLALLGRGKLMLEGEKGWLLVITLSPDLFPTFPSYLALLSGAQ